MKKVSKKELKYLYIGDFKEGDKILVDDKYLIRVKYGDYSHPSLETTVSDIKSSSFKDLGVTVGVRGGRPYFIDNFISNRDKPAKSKALEDKAGGKWITKNGKRIFIDNK